MFPLGFCSKEDRCPEDALKRSDEAAVLRAPLLHPEGVQRSCRAIECDMRSLLPHCQRREENGNQPILARGQTIASSFSVTNGRKTGGRSLSAQRHTLLAARSQALRPTPLQNAPGEDGSRGQATGDADEFEALRSRFNQVPDWAVEHFGQAASEEAVRTLDARQYRAPCATLGHPGRKVAGATQRLPASRALIAGVREPALALGWSEAQLAAVPLDTRQE